MTPLREELARLLADADAECMTYETMADWVMPLITREVAAARKAALEEAAKVAEANQLTGVPHGLTVMEAEIGRTMHAMTRDEIAAAIRKLGEG
jgi:hypothetical protein